MKSELLQKLLEFVEYLEMESAEDGVLRIQPRYMHPDRFFNRAPLTMVDMAIQDAVFKGMLTKKEIDGVPPEDPEQKLWKAYRDTANV